MKKLIAAFTSLLLLYGMLFPVGTAWGATGGVDITNVQASIDVNQLVTVTGSISSGAGTQVTIAVTDPGGQPEYLNTAVSGSGGNFTFSYTFRSGKPGTYTVTLGAAGLEKLVETSFYYGNNAGLSSLSTSLPNIDSAFSPDQTSYTSTVDDRVESCTVTPTAYDSAATIKVNGSAVQSSKASDAITLNTGENTVSIVVTAPDGTQKTYSIMVTKNAGIITSVEASASIDSNKLVTVSGTLSSGSDQSVSIKILDPQNNVEYVNNLTTTAEGKFELEYKLTNPLTGKYSVIIGAVGAQLPLETCYFDYGMDAALKNLYLSNLNLSQPFQSGVENYTAEVGEGLDALNVTAVADDPAAKINVNGTEVQRGEPSQEIKLSEGLNPITITVTAQDGVTRKIYSVIVKKDNSAVMAAVNAQIDRNCIVSISGKLNFVTDQQASVMVTGPDGKINYLNSAALSTDLGFQFTYAMTSKVYGKYVVTIGGQGLAPVASTYFIYDPQNADLANLTLNYAALCQAFEPDTTLYDSNAECSTNYVTVTPTAYVPDAKIKVNSLDVQNGGTSGAINLNYGTNSISITITSEDESVQKTYTVRVEKSAPSASRGGSVTHTVSVAANPTVAGTVSGGGTYAEGASVTVTASVNNSYNFVNWTESGTQVSTSAAFTFPMGTTDRSLVANFAANTPVPPVTHTVSVAANPTAAGTVSGGGTYAEGASVTVTASVNNSYNFVNWTESGTQVSTSAAFTFPMGTTDRSLVANFAVTSPVTTQLTGVMITVQDGGTLMASVTPSNATASYQWQESSDDTNYTPISGATSSTYTPVQADVGQYIEVVATGTGNYTGTVTSSPLRLVPAV
ncbi:MAG: cadherin-like beta sandwich domain-containing protein [Desulfosporosinus sp.]|nr:cadherin-like beta sandwich domain-containing protein [Desulfosporosinus sp.]